MICHAMSCSGAHPAAGSSVSCLPCIVPPSRSRLACGAALFRAYRMCPRAPVGAGAVRAPDCAREPGARHTSPVRSVGDFLRRRETGDEAASGCRFVLSHSTMVFSGSSPLRRIISPFLELARQVGRSCPDRPPVEPVAPRGDAFGQRLLGPAGEAHRLARPLAGRGGRGDCGLCGPRDVPRRARHPSRPEARHSHPRLRGHAARSDRAEAARLPASRPRRGFRRHRLPRRRKSTRRRRRAGPWVRDRFTILAAEIGRRAYDGRI